MTESQQVTREERVAIMMVCGNVSEYEAQCYCDRHPDLYGLREIEEVQQQLI